MAQRPIQFVEWYFQKWIAARATLSRHADHVFFALSLKAYDEDDKGRVRWRPRVLCAWCKMPMDEFMEAVEELVEVEKVSQTEEHLVMLGTVDRMDRAHKALEGRYARTEAGRAALKVKAAENIAKSSVTEGVSRREEREEREEKGNKEVQDTLPGVDHVSMAFDAFKDAAKMAGWPIPGKLSETRKAKLLLALRDVGGIEGWKALVAACAASRYLTGKTKARFFMPINFLLEDENRAKVMEGNYDNRAGQGSSTALDMLRDGDD